MKRQSKKRECKKCESKKREAKIETLCWKCKRALPTYGCEWADNFEPVKGWNAIPTKLKNGYNSFIDSYIVIECPKFEQDSEEAENEHC